MWKYIALTLTLIAAGCSGETGETGGDSLAMAAPSPDDHEESQGHPWADFDEPMGDAVDKTLITALHGWAVEGQLYERCTNSQGQPISPCVWGYGPVDLNSTGLTDFTDNLLGRCGKYLDGEDFSFMPCLLPYAPDTVSGKRWKYKITWSDCPADANAPTRKANLSTGIRNAFAAAEIGTGWDFVETTGNDQNITVRCAFGSEVTELNNASAQGAAGAGFPTGWWAFRHAAPFTITDSCTDGALPTFDDTLAHLSDQYFSYNTGVILINWSKFWTYSAACSEASGGNAFYQRAAKHVGLHELGHILGFGHMQYTSHPDNIMYSQRSCARFNAPPASYLPYVRMTLDRMDYPNSDPVLRVDRGALTCYDPN